MEQGRMQKFLINCDYAKKRYNIGCLDDIFIKINYSKRMKNKDIYSYLNDDEKNTILDCPTYKEFWENTTYLDVLITGVAISHYLNDFNSIYFTRSENRWRKILEQADYYDIKLEVLYSNFTVQYRERIYPYFIDIICYFIENLSEEQKKCMFDTSVFLRLSMNMSFKCEYIMKKIKEIFPMARDKDYIEYCTHNKIYEKWIYAVDDHLKNNIKNSLNKTIPETIRTYKNQNIRYVVFDVTISNFHKKDYDEWNYFSNKLDIIHNRYNITFNENTDFKEKFCDKMYTYKRNDYTDYETIFTYIFNYLEFISK